MGMGVRGLRSAPEQGGDAVRLPCGSPGGAERPCLWASLALGAMCAAALAAGPWWGAAPGTSRHAAWRQLSVALRCACKRENQHEDFPR